MTNKNTILTGTTSMFVALLAGTILVIGFALPYTADAALLTQQLDFGMTNPDVASLQTFLAQDPTIYPQGLVTSYFGLLTKAAVSNFQVRNGIAAVGRVGPITLLAINNQMGGYSDTTEGAGKVVHYGVPQPILSNINVLHMSNSATITWNSNVLATARVMYSTVWPFGYRNAPSITSSTGVSTTQSVTLSNLQSNTTYFYVVESLDSQGNFSWSRNGASFKTD